MDLETLRRTVEELIESTAPIAQNHPIIRLDNKDFAKLLQVAKEKFSHNEVIQNMNPGEWKNEITATSLLQKLSILKAELEEKQ
jgi:hypothetical protein